MQDARFKFLEKRGKMDSHFHGNDIRSNEIAALSSKARNDRGTKTNNIYLQMGKMCKTCGKIAS